MTDTSQKEVNYTNLRSWLDEIRIRREAGHKLRLQDALATADFGPRMGFSDETDTTAHYILVLRAKADSYDMGLEPVFSEALKSRRGRELMLGVVQTPSYTPLKAEGPGTQRYLVYYTDRQKAPVPIVLGWEGEDEDGKPISKAPEEDFSELMEACYQFETLMPDHLEPRDAFHVTANGTAVRLDGIQALVPNPEV